MVAGFAQTYHVELLYREKPVLDSDKVRAALRQNCGSIDLNTPLVNGGSSLQIIHLDHRVQFKEGSAPASTVVIPSDTLAKDSGYQEALQQSWMWDEARNVFPQCRHSVLIMDMMASGLDYKARLTVMHGVVKSLVSATPCTAIFWKMSQQFINPADYLAALTGPEPRILVGALNVRMFNVQNRGVGETVMDTLGLAALDVPDVQCHFVNLDPESVAGMLFNIGHYLFERGDVINDGETVQGVQPSDKWKCQHEMALVGPERLVLDVNPGAPYAAGAR